MYIKYTDGVISQFTEKWRNLYCKFEILFDNILEVLGLGGSSLLIYPNDIIS